MLSSLLPGIREVRAPFVAGFITLVALYLLFDRQIAILTQPSAVDNGIRTVTSLLGLSGRLAVGGIIAYLVGALSSTDHAHRIPPAKVTSSLRAARRSEHRSHVKVMIILLSVRRGL